MKLFHIRVSFLFGTKAFPSGYRYGCFNMVFSVARKYMIESVIIAAILAPWRKAEWKSFIKKSVITHWVTILRAYAAIKSTLSCIDLHDVNPHSSPPHLV